MSWYSEFKEASGKFDVPYVAETLIPYLATEVKKKWMDMEFEFVLKESVKIGDFLGLSKYQPTNDSPYKKIFDDPNKEIKIVFIFSVIYVNTPDTINAYVREVESDNQALLVYIRFYINNGERKSLINNPMDYFNEKFLSSSRVNFRFVVEHEITHSIRRLLGYERSENKNYVFPDGTDSGFRKYLAQESEREEMYVIIQQGLEQCVKNNLTRCPDAFLLTFKMYDAFKKEYPKDLRRFQARIIGILNDVESKIVNDKEKVNNWTNNVKSRIVKIITGDLEIS